MLEYILHYMAEIGMVTAIMLVSAVCILDTINPSRNTLSNAALGNIIKGAVALFIFSAVVIAY
ncbi:MAG: hypothetical protein ACP5MZ_02590 [Candidatus Micrarchaeia archaeon]